MSTSNPLILAGEADKLALDLMKKLLELQRAVGFSEEDEEYYTSVRLVQNSATALQQNTNRLTTARLATASREEIHEAHETYWTKQ